MTNIPSHADVAWLLTLSDERDQGQRVCLARERAAYERGRADGIEAGRRLEAAERDAGWARIAKPIARGGPTYAELQKRRRGGAAA